MRAIGATLLGMVIAVLGAGPAMGAASTGGVAPTAASTPTAAPAAPQVPPNAAPIVARSSSLAYHGPVYMKTATGQVVPYVSASATASSNVATGGSPVAPSVAVPTKPELLVPGTRAKVINGQAAAPMSAPAPVQAMIWTANQIIGLPYIFGGGHNATFTSRGYDCSGTVSFALHGASLLSAPADSSEFESWGGAGIGQWVTIFANAGHAYMDVAGVRLDTSAADDPSDQQGPRWRPLRHGNSGYTVRHPVNL
jgi:cell wall-associated NlpC family hydrolase